MPHQFSVYTESINAHTFKYKIKKEDTPISFSIWIDLLKTNQAFRSFYTDTLNACPFPAYFWEAKPITKNSLNDDFEFVLINSTRLAAIQKAHDSFQTYFKNEELATSFYNIGRDAKLVVPCPEMKSHLYIHLAIFLRNTSEQQMHEFWTKVATEYESMINEQPLWLSTSGLGVYWTHVRLDSHPKYYQHQAYRTI